MSRPQIKNILNFDFIYRVLAAMLLSVGSAMPLLRCFAPDAGLTRVICYCVLFSLLFRVLPRSKKTLLGGLAVFAACEAVLMLFTGSELFSGLFKGGQAIYLYMRGVNVSGMVYADEIALLCTFATALFAKPATDEDMGFILPACFVLTEMMLLWFLSDKSMLLYSLPALAGIALLMAAPAPAFLEKSKKPALRALPVIALAVALSCALLPAPDTTLEPFKTVAQTIKQYIEDNYLFTESRDSFSLVTEGYQPLGYNRLGGRATPETHSVMQVTTPETIYMRGTVLNEYTGSAWYDTVSSQRYNYNSGRYTALRETLTDYARPYMLSPAEKTASVHILRAGTTTLYVPQRLRELYTANMTPYFNNAGEVFITRDIASGDEYTFTYLSLISGTDEMREIADANQNVSDPRYDEVTSTYLALPKHIQQEVWDIANAVTQGAQTPYDKALAIRDYLSNNYAYSLNVSDPPEKIDFVAYFLLSEKKGYCTYFATAMTVLCRMAGLPARYIEGFLARPDETGVALVTGEDAHAWTEVYLNGVGWVTFDATPSQNRNQPQPSQSPKEAPAENTPSPSPQNTPTPQAQDTPTPEPSAAPSDEPDVQTPTPAPDDAPQPSEEPENNNAPQNEQAPEQKGSFPWLLLILLLLVFVYCYRLYATYPVRMAAKMKTQRAAFSVYASAVMQMLGLLHLKRMKTETLWTFAFRVKEKTGLNLSAFFASVNALAYGRGERTANDVKAGQQAYALVYGKLNIVQKALYAFLRTVTTRKVDDTKKRGHRK